MSQHAGKMLLALFILFFSLNALASESPGHIGLLIKIKRGYKLNEAIKILSEKLAVKGYQFEKPHEKFNVLVFSFKKIGFNVHVKKRNVQNLLKVL